MDYLFQNIAYKSFGRKSFLFTKIWYGEHILVHNQAITNYAR